MRLEKAAQTVDGRNVVDAHFSDRDTSNATFAFETCGVFSEMTFGEAKVRTDEENPRLPGQMTSEFPGTPIALFVQ